jgi:transcriptional regulator NrdR family protein
MQIRVTKADGSTEAYLHTKVLGSLHRAIAAVQSDCLETAQMLSDAVTYFLYRRCKGETLTTDQIHQMVLTVLEGAGFAAAAEALTSHRLNRRLQRRRISVIDSECSAWDKGLIVRDLIEHYQIEAALARAIAGLVEEKILRMGAAHIRKGLIRHLVMTDMEDLLDAHYELTGEMCPAL